MCFYLRVSFWFLCLELTEDVYLPLLSRCLMGEGVVRTLH